MMNLKKLFSVALLALTVSGCGDQDPIRVAEGGIVGTGISLGPVTGFGSIYINGVKYNTDTATFIRDGIQVPGQDYFNKGEYIRVEGDIYEGGKTGLALKVIFDNILEGNVTRAATGNEIEILGQTVQVGALTLFNGFSSLSELNGDHVIEVSGLRDDAGVIYALGMTLKPQPDNPEVLLDLEGEILALSQANQTLRIGNQTIDYANAVVEGDPANVLMVGEYIEVHSRNPLQQGMLIADKIALHQALPEFTPGDYNEFTGVVTADNPDAGLEVNGIPVVVQSDSLPNDGTASAIAVGSLLEVAGNINGEGEIIAENVEVRQPSMENLVTFTDVNISNVSKIVADDTTAEAQVAVAEFYVNNDQIEITDTTLFVNAASVNDVMPGELVTVQGMRLDDGSIRALRIDVMPAPVVDAVSP